ncbi:hypothetical protein B296_00024376 [Ensete ventricosum]|uniref:Uncharacterized protein n=1 Tax=Ensete ventricosum TaxID=4639 RepID=A0A426ZKM4_ENSVE|nr:hypothetical protein B296_00024376 [Ensete ventricosum]
MLLPPALRVLVSNVTLDVSATTTSCRCYTESLVSSAKIVDDVEALSPKTRRRRHLIFCVRRGRVATDLNRRGRAMPDFQVLPFLLPRLILPGSA